MLYPLSYEGLPGKYRLARGRLLHLSGRPRGETNNASRARGRLPAEVGFGLKVTGEVGNVAVARAGGEANYDVKFIWSELEINT